MRERVCNAMWRATAAVLATCAVAQEPEAPVRVILRGPGHAPEDAPPERPQPTASLYDLGDLLTKVQPSETVVLQQAKGDLEVLVELFSQFVEPPLGPGEELLPVGDRWLALVGQPEHHAWLTQRLRRARQDEARGAAGQTSIVRMTHFHLGADELAALVELLPEIRREGPEGEVRFQPVLLSGSDAAADLLGSLGGSAAGKDLGKEGVIMSQSIGNTGFRMASFGLGYARLINQTAYIRDFEVEIQAAAAVADPIVDVVRDGFSTTVGCLELDDGTFGIAARLWVADLQRPIPVFTTTIGVGNANEVKIQLPRVQFGSSDAVVRLPRGDTLLLVGPEVGKGRVVAAVKVADRPR